MINIVRLISVARYFFDTRDNDRVFADDVGIELPSFDRVKIEATRSLAELALDVLPGSYHRCLGVDVRNEANQLILSTELAFEARERGEHAQIC